ncbi:MAG: hypothetical protein LUQ19_00255 [Methanoregula sp.]|nr:hypothetical protein [Methanoregula sp.]
MDKRTTAVLVAGILVTILLCFINIYLAGIALIILVAIVMSLYIMQDTTFMPLVEARLRDDAKAIVLTNSGNSPAVRIHVALVPMDIEYDLPSLGVDESHEFSLASMVREVKVVIGYENEKGHTFTHARKLSSTDDFEPLKPMFPVFGWK